MKVKIKEIAKVVNGSTPSTKCPEYYDGDILWITPKDLSEQGEKYIYRGERTITQAGYNSCSTEMIPKNNILMSSRAPIGLLAINKVDCCTNQGFKNLVINKSKCHEEFLYYYLKYHIKEIEALGSGTTFKEVSKKSIEEYEIELPSLDIQKKVIKVLTNLDEKIINNNKINTELESMAKTIYDYWFLQFEFPSEERKPYKSSGGKMVWNEALKREIPEGWECGTIGNLFSSQSGYAFKSSNWTKNGYPVLTIKCINEDGTINMRESSYVKEYIDSFNKYSVKNGNMIFAMSGNTIGKLGIIASNINNILINQRILIIKTDINNMAYSYFTIKNDKIQNNIVQLGANSAQPNISEDLLRNIKICFPNKKHLDNYNNICKVIFEKIITNRIENEELTSLRDFLLPLLMNGQVGFKKVALADV